MNTPSATHEALQLDRDQLLLYVKDFTTLLSQREQAYQSLYNAHLNMLQRLARAAEYKDDDTGIHLARMAKYSEILARELGMPDQYCELILHASPMHDIGKIGIPDEILKKNSQLTADEWLVMKKHPEYGAEILGDSDVPIIKMAVEIALCHHEKFDGSGYPYGLKGHDIPLSARIVSLADFYDALTMDRCYRPAKPDKDVLEMIKAESGTHFDPDIVHSFVKIHQKLRDARIEINQEYQISESNGS